MAVEMSAIYQGELRCEATHGPSRGTVITDAPTDNMGKGQSFSPTDLVGVALGTCMLTTMAIVANRDSVELRGARVRVTKEMITSPNRKIGALTVDFELPASLPADYRQKMETTALTCPVHRSLHPDVKIPVTFRYV